MEGQLPARLRRASQGDESFDIDSLSPAERKALVMFNPTLGTTLGVDKPKKGKSLRGTAWERVAAQARQQARDAVPDLEPTRSFVTRTAALHSDNRSRNSKYKVTMLDRNSATADQLLGGKTGTHRVKGKRSSMIATKDSVVIVEETVHCTVDPHSRWMKRWDLVMLGLLMFTAMITPVEVSFFDNSDIDAMFVLNRLVDLFFLADVGLQFFVPFNHPVTHELITDNRAIAFRYLRGWFTIDLVSIFPWDLVGSGDPNASRLALFRVVRLLRLAKLLRVVRASRILSRWRNRFGIAHSSLSLMKFFLIIILVSHWSACVFHLAAAIQEDLNNINWIRVLYGQCPQFTYAEDCLREDLVLPPITSPLADGMQRYLGSVYWSVATIATIGYGDIIPMTDAERAVALLTMLLGGGVYAYIVGAVYGIVSTMDRATMEYNAHMDHLNKFMEEIHYPDDGRFIIRAYFDAFKRLFRQQYYQGLLNHLSPSLRQKVALHMHAEWLNNIPYFNAPNRHEREDFITAIAVVLQPKLFAPLETILRLGYMNKHLYIIQRGLAIVRSRVVGAGQYFGDTWILSNGRCTDSVRSITYLYCMTLSRKALNSTLETGNFEATRRMIRKSVIRLALRREFLKCAALARLQRRVLRRLAKAEAVAQAAAKPTHSPESKGAAAPSPAHLFARMTTTTGSDKDILGGIATDSRDMTHTLLTAIGGEAGRHMVRLSEEVLHAEGSYIAPEESKASAAAAAAAAALATELGNSDDTVGAMPVSGSARLAAAAAAAEAATSVGDDKSSIGGGLEDVMSVHTGRDLHLSGRGKGTGRISTEPSTGSILAGLSTASPEPSLLSDAATRESLAAKWQQLHADMPLLARIMTRASLPTAAQMAEKPEERAAAGALLGIPHEEDLDASTLQNPNYTLTRRGQQKVKYRLRATSVTHVPFGAPAVVAPALQLPQGHPGDSPMRIGSRRELSSSMGEEDGSAKHSTAHLSGGNVRGAASGGYMPVSHAVQDEAVDRDAVKPAGEVFSPSAHGLPLPAASRLDLRTAVSFMSGAVPASQVMEAGRAPRRISLPRSPLLPRDTEVPLPASHEGEEGGEASALTGGATPPASPSGAAGESKGGRPPLQTSTSDGRLGVAEPHTRRAVNLRVKSAMHVGHGAMLDDSGGAAPQEGARAGGRPDGFTAQVSQRGGFAGDEVALPTSPPDVDGGSQALVPAGGTGISGSHTTLSKTGGNTMVSAVSVLHKLSETLTAVQHMKGDTSQSLARVRSQITSVYLEARTLRWAVLFLMLLVVVLMVLVIVLLLGE